MPLTINAKPYTGDGYALDSVSYLGPAKTVSTKDDLVLRRQNVKPSMTFSGVSRTFAKLTRTLNLTGALTPTGDAFIQNEVMIPIGFAAADVDALLNDMAAFVASAAFKAHVKSRLINFSE